MVITCHVCTEGIRSDGSTCSHCGGDGEIDLTDPSFRQIEYGPMITLVGLVWNTLLTNQANMEDKLDDIKDKCNDIKEKVDEL